MVVVNKIRKKLLNEFEEISIFENEYSKCAIVKGIMLENDIVQLSFNRYEFPEIMQVKMDFYIKNLKSEIEDNLVVIPNIKSRIYYLERLKEDFEKCKDNIKGKKIDVEGKSHRILRHKNIDYKELFDAANVFSLPPNEIYLQVSEYLKIQKATIESILKLIEKSLNDILPNKIESELTWSRNKGDKELLVALIRILIENKNIKSRVRSNISDKEIMRLFGEFLNIDMKNYSANLGSLKKYSQSFEDYLDKLKTKYRDLMGNLE